MFKTERNIHTSILRVPMLVYYSQYPIQDGDLWWAVVNMVMSLHIPLKAGNFLTADHAVSFSSRTLCHGIS
jgi:hypothetical protein